MSIFATTEDFLSVADVIDLNHNLHDLNSIGDDELKLFHRNLITPEATVYSGDDDLPYQSMSRKRFTMSKSHHERPVSRSESVMLFHNINNGDDDVSIDLVSSKLKDFMDIDFTMNETYSRPVSKFKMGTRNNESSKNIVPVILNHEQSKPLVPGLNTMKLLQTTLETSTKKKRNAPQAHIRVMQATSQSVESTRQRTHQDKPKKVANDKEVTVKSRAQPKRVVNEKQQDISSKNVPKDYAFTRLQGKTSNDSSYKSARTNRNTSTAEYSTRNLVLDKKSHLPTYFKSNLPEKAIYFSSCPRISSYENTCLIKKNAASPRSSCFTSTEKILYRSKTSLGEKTPFLERHLAEEKSPLVPRLRNNSYKEPSFVKTTTTQIERIPYPQRRDPLEETSLFKQSRTEKKSLLTPRLRNENASLSRRNPPFQTSLNSKSKVLAEYASLRTKINSNEKAANSSMRKNSILRTSYSLPRLEIKRPYLTTHLKEDSHETLSYLKKPSLLLPPRVSAKEVTILRGRSNSALPKNKTSDPGDIKQTEISCVPSVPRRITLATKNKRPTRPQQYDSTSSSSSEEEYNSRHVPLSFQITSYKPPHVYQNFFEKGKPYYADYNEPSRLKAINLKSIKKVQPYTTDEGLSVIDSAKQVLESVRERRKKHNRCS